MIPQADDVESLSMVGRSREERLEMFMNTFNDEFKACWDSDDAGVDPHTGRRPMKFRDFASHQLDMIETDVSTYVMFVYISIFHCLCYLLMCR